ncbi:RHS repeat-associated core domain-containing protein [Variovorax sp. Varisp36]|uniref:RHS repeat-associated core domain-containing protein n=1 Tax=Variovorax sp. Varisp36 TaxID=3243031 RepID=UPI0039A41159
MRSAETFGETTSFSYDALGRRIPKRSSHATTLFGWDGDTLAFESTQASRAARNTWGRGDSVHYIHEPGSFVPLVQIRQAQAVALSQTTDVKALIAANGGRYDIERDPLWNGEQLNQPPQPFSKEEIAFYQCDHLGTPQELTDHEGRIAWSASYKAWGEAKQAISEAGRRAGFRNPIRFQGQYFDDETGLHYNRYRYYDPVSGRFVGRDPIGLAGGTNLHLFVPNPVQWVDPFGLTCHPTRRASLREIRRQLGIPMSQQPIGQKMIPLTDSTGGWILGEDKKPIMTRELTYQVNGKNVVVQDHSAGHYYGEGGVGDQPSHHNVRPEQNTRTGKVDGMDDHYYFNCRNKK